MFAPQYKLNILNFEINKLFYISARLIKFFLKTNSPTILKETVRIIFMHEKAFLPYVQHTYVHNHEDDSSFALDDKRITLKLHDELQRDNTNAIKWIVSCTLVVCNI